MGKLGDLIHRQAKAREESEVAEIVGGGDAPRRGAFGSACAQAQKSTAEEELERARQELIRNPRVIAGGPDAVGAFLGQFPRADRNELRRLVGKAQAVLRPPRTFDDIPTAEAGEFVRLKR
jgi:hypothetical protein